MTSRRSHRPDRYDENDMGLGSLSRPTRATKQRNDTDGTIRPTLAGRMLRPAPLLIAAAALALGAAASIASNGLSSTHPSGTSLPRSEASSAPGAHDSHKSEAPSPSAGPRPRAGATTQPAHDNQVRQVASAQPCGTHAAALWTPAKPGQQRSGHGETSPATALKAIEHEHDLIVKALSTIQGMQGQLKQAAGSDSQQLAQTAEKLCVRDKTLAGQADALQHLLATADHPVSTPEPAAPAKTPIAAGLVVSGGSPAAGGSALPAHDGPGDDQAKSKDQPAVSVEAGTAPVASPTGSAAPAAAAVSADVGTAPVASPTGSGAPAAPAARSDLEQAAPAGRGLNPLPDDNANPVDTPVNCPDLALSCPPQPTVSPVFRQRGCPPLNRPLAQTCLGAPCLQPYADGVTTSGEAPVASIGTPQDSQDAAAISGGGVAPAASGCGIPALPHGVMTCLSNGAGQDDATVAPLRYSCRPLRSSRQGADTAACAMNPFALTGLPADPLGEDGDLALLTRPCDPLPVGLEAFCSAAEGLGLPGMTC